MALRLTVTETAGYLAHSNEFKFDFVPGIANVFSKMAQSKMMMMIMRVAPNNSFKPSPLRGLGPTGTALGGPA